MQSESLNDTLNEMLNEGISLTPTYYFAYMFGPPECWPEDREEALPGIFRIVSKYDLVGQIKGSS
jgi:hypothetical protein